MTPTSPHGFAVLPSSIARDPAIEPILKAILLALSSFAGADQSCFPSNKTLCECTGLSERAVREWLGIGAERGLLTVHRRLQENGAPASNLYSLNFAKWGESLARQTVPGVSANPAGGVGRHGAPGGAQPCPRWGATVPPNNTSDQDQENKTTLQSTPLSSVAAPTGAKGDKGKQASLLGEEPTKPKKQSLVQKPPTADETKAIFAALGCPQSRMNVALNCLDYWTAQGFKRKAGPILDWPATCRTWWRNEVERNGGGTPTMRVGKLSIPVVRQPVVDEEPDVEF